MGDEYDFGRIRNRLIDLERALERFRPTTIDNGTMALLVRTKAKAAYPTAPDAVFYCEVLRCKVAPVEGATPVITGKSHHLYAANVGGRLPPEGTILIALYIAGMWTFRYA